MYSDWAVKLIERTVCALIHPKEEDEEPRLRFITGGMLSTAELSILQARKEIHLFCRTYTPDVRHGARFATHRKG